MHYWEQRKIRWPSFGYLMLVASALCISSFQAIADQTREITITSPTKFKQYHVKYDVNADWTFSELNEVVMTVLNDQGVQNSKQMPVGFPNFAQAKQTEVQIVKAYTLKSSGERIDAIQENPPVGDANGGLPKPANVPKPMKLVSFQKVEVGDTLVLSYKTTQRAPFPPNNIVLFQYFPKFMEYDDAEVSLTAPASLNLRFETVGVEEVENTNTGDVRKLLWRFQNKTPETIFSVNKPPIPESFPRIHISSFKDDIKEKEELARFAPPAQHCKVYPEDDGPGGMLVLNLNISNFFWNAEERLKSNIQEWTTYSCTLVDGRPKLTALKAGIGRAFDQQHDWSKSFNRVEDLKKKYPKEAFVALAEAIYWVDYAWNARGTGYASTVTPDGWRLFKERLEKAEKVLLDSKPYASSLPVWYEEMIIVQSALDRPAEDRDQTFLEGAKRFKTYYPTYFTMLNYLSPKWGGSWETVDNLVKWSVENTKDKDGNSMYARLYWSAAGILPEDTSLFKDTLASWPKMKKGFEELMKRYPDSRWNLNNFARFACEAGDKKTFLNLRKEIDKNVIDDAWTKRNTLELCEVKFGYSQ